MVQKWIIRYVDHFFILDKEKIRYVHVAEHRSTSIARGSYCRFSFLRGTSGTSYPKEKKKQKQNDLSMISKESLECLSLQSPGEVRHNLWHWLLILQLSQSPSEVPSASIQNPNFHIQFPPYPYPNPNPIHLSQAQFHFLIATTNQ